MKKTKSNVIRLIFCEFCGTGSEMKEGVDRLFVVGIVDRVCICSDCVDICNGIIAERRAVRASAEPETPVAVDPVVGIGTEGSTRAQEGI